MNIRDTDAVTGFIRNIRIALGEYTYINKYQLDVLDRHDDDALITTEDGKQLAMYRLRVRNTCEYLLRCVAVFSDPTEPIAITVVFMQPDSEGKLTPYIDDVLKMNKEYTLSQLAQAATEFLAWVEKGRLPNGVLVKVPA